MYNKMIEDLKKQELMIKAIMNVSDHIADQIKWSRLHVTDDEGNFVKDENDEYIYRDPVEDDENEYAWRLPYSETKVWRYLLKCLEDAAEHNKIK